MITLCWIQVLCYAQCAMVAKANILDIAIPVLNAAKRILDIVTSYTKQGYI